ncbi:Nematocyst expressed protein 6 [Diplonema papillatum]|nr:Nematocyst expressed protein 6 [Diplonema papillatum]
MRADPSMQQVFLLLLCPLLGAAAVGGGGAPVLRLTEAADRREMMLANDIRVPEHLRREANPMGAVYFTGKSQLWEGGRVNFVIDTQTTNPDNAAPELLPEDDPRILGAIAHWEDNTCIRFTRCADVASCATPYIRFRSDLNACNSLLGRSPFGVNDINLASGCTLGVVIHEIGHSMGLSHEQSRNDRDNFVTVDFTEIEPGLEDNFDKTGSNGRDLGPYDYRSIMHYSSYTFATGGDPVIISPQPIGQRSSLSAGDIASIHFLYNFCEAYTVPVCLASRDTSQTLLIPHSSAFSIEIDAEWAESSQMVVTYPTTTAPAAQFTVTPGSTVADSVKTFVSFTPSPADAGQTFTVGATFRDSGSALAATCTATVRIADSDAVCFGKSKTDPAVCSGRGVCTSDPLQPCVCDAGAGGAMCAGYENCPANIFYAFDDAEDRWSDTATLDGGFKVSGSSMKLEGYTVVELDPQGVFSWITFHFAANTTGVQFGAYDTLFGNCFYFDFEEVIQVTGVSTGVRLEPNQFYFIEVLLHPEDAQYSVRIDGDEVVTRASLSGQCHTTGVQWLATFVAEGEEAAWFDEFNFYCHSHVFLTGSLMTAEQAGLIAGGLSLTLVVDGDLWVDSEQTKSDLIDCMTSDYPAPNEWDDLKATMLDTSLVTITGNEMVVGPLNPAPGYAAENIEVRVSVCVKDSMTESGEFPFGYQDLSFEIEGLCPRALFFGFDEFISLPIGFSYSATAVEGPYSLSLPGRLAGGGTPTYSLDVGGIRPDFVSYYTQYGENSATDPTYVQVFAVSDTGTQFGFLVGFFTVFSVYGANGVESSSGSANPNQWYFVEWAFDWEARTATFSVDGSVFAADIQLPPAAQFSSVRYMSVAGWSTPSYLDSLQVGCGGRPPAFTVAPEFFVPSVDRPHFEFFMGSSPLSLDDAVAVVSGAATDCGGVDVACASLGACSASAGFLVKTEAGVGWHEGDFTGLSSATTYKVCYRASASGEFELLESNFTTGEDAEATAAPQTSAPPTTAPATNVPLSDVPPTAAPATTEAPSTSAPPTAAPATVAPPTAAPSTNAPSTAEPAASDSPLTGAPQTAAPPTSAPSTDAPPSVAPGASRSPPTEAPSTTAPATLSPATSAPPTEAPATNAPATLSPATSAPPTEAPATTAPATAVPDASGSPPTAAPLTRAPPTGVPPTNAPATLSPATSAPPTEAPATTAPATAVPDASGSPPTAAPLTRAPPTGVPPTNAPATLSPATSAPATEAPGTSGPAPVVPPCPTPRPRKSPWWRVPNSYKAPRWYWRAPPKAPKRRSSFDKFSGKSSGKRG